MGVSSFGRHEEPKLELEASEVVLLPPLAVPAVQVPLAVVIDNDALAAAAQYISDTIAAAVHDGFAQGVAGLVESEEAGPAGEAGLLPCADQAPGTRTLPVYQGMTPAAAAAEPVVAGS